MELAHDPKGNHKPWFVCPTCTMDGNTLFDEGRAIPRLTYVLNKRIHLRRGIDRAVKKAGLVGNGEYAVLVLSLR